LAEKQTDLGEKPVSSLHPTERGTVDCGLWAVGLRRTRTLQNAESPEAANYNSDE
jgi:hypothetical protein